MKYVVVFCLLFGCTRSNPLANGGCVCNALPASFCVDAITLRNFAGVCVGGTCQYPHWDTTCQGGCGNSACIGNDPCDGLQCVSPPAAACAGAGTLVSYSSSGSCANGVCQYASVRTTCAGGCANGACTGDACAGVVCDQAPPPVCVDANTLRTFSAGTCSGGVCSYAPADVTCACAGGACQGSDPCANVACFDPPAPVCLSSTTLQTYDAFGTCSGGVCSYPSSTQLCPSNAPCSDGACNCIPSCGGKACGAGDGCGGQCQSGPCSDPKTICQAGACVCKPTCSNNAACGSADGCGGLCLANCSGMCATLCTDNSGCDAGTCWPDAVYLSDCVSTGCHALPCKTGYKEIPSCDTAGLPEATPLCIRNEITDFWTRPEGVDCPAGTHIAFMVDSFNTTCSSGPAPGGGFLYFDKVCLRDH